MSGGEHSPPELASEIATGIGLFFSPCSLGCAFPSDIKLFCYTHLKLFTFFAVSCFVAGLGTFFVGSMELCDKNVMQRHKTNKKTVCLQTKF